MSFQFSETYVTPIAAGAAAEPWASHDPHPFRTLSLDMEEHPAGLARLFHGVRVGDGSDQGN